MASDRLTEEWTDTLDEAFGATGTKGRLGEEFMCKVFDKWGWEWKRNESDYQAQIEGKDIEFRKPGWKRAFTGDVKNNMNDRGYYYVHRDWLYKVKCDRIFHVNPDTGWVVWYGVKEMKDHWAWYEETYGEQPENMLMMPSDTRRYPWIKARQVKV